MVACFTWRLRLYGTVADWRNQRVFPSADVFKPLYMILSVIEEVMVAIPGMLAGDFSVALQNIIRKFTGFLCR